MNHSENISKKKNISPQKNELLTKFRINRTFDKRQSRLSSSIFEILSLINLMILCFFYIPIFE